MPGQSEAPGKTLEGSPGVRASMCRHGPGKSTCNAAGEVGGGAVQPAGGADKVFKACVRNLIRGFLTLLVSETFWRSV